MPADESLPQTSSARHGNGDAPYWCYSVDKLPRAKWSLTYAHVCRHSLDPEGRGDRRCPTDCKHRETDEQFAGFKQIYETERRGAQAASDWLEETT